MIPGAHRGSGRGDVSGASPGVGLHRQFRHGDLPEHGGRLRHVAAGPAGAVSASRAGGRGGVPAEAGWGARRASGRRRGPASCPAPGVAAVARGRRRGFALADLCRRHVRGRPAAFDSGQAADPPGLVAAYPVDEPSAHDLWTGDEGSLRVCGHGPGLCRVSQVRAVVGGFMDAAVSGRSVRVAHRGQFSLVLQPAAARAGTAGGLRRYLSSQRGRAPR